MNQNKKHKQNENEQPNQRVPELNQRIVIVKKQNNMEKQDNQEIPIKKISNHNIENFDLDELNTIQKNILFIMKKNGQEINEEIFNKIKNLDDRKAWIAEALTINNFDFVVFFKENNMEDLTFFQAILIRDLINENIDFNNPIYDIAFKNKNLKNSHIQLIVNLIKKDICLNDPLFKKVLNSDLKTPNIFLLNNLLKYNFQNNEFFIDKVFNHEITNQQVHTIYMLFEKNFYEKEKFKKIFNMGEQQTTVIQCLIRNDKLTQEMFEKINEKKDLNYGQVRMLNTLILNQDIDTFLFSKIINDDTINNIQVKVLCTLFGLGLDNNKLYDEIKNKDISLSQLNILKSLKRAQVLDENLSYKILNFKTTLAQEAIIHRLSGFYRGEKRKELYEKIIDNPDKVFVSVYSFFSFSNINLEEIDSKTSLENKQNDNNFIFTHSMSNHEIFKKISSIKDIFDVQEKIITKKLNPNIFLNISRDSFLNDYKKVEKIFNENSFFKNKNLKENEIFDFKLYVLRNLNFNKKEINLENVINEIENIFNLRKQYQSISIFKDRKIYLFANDEMIFNENRFGNEYLVDILKNYSNKNLEIFRKQEEQDFDKFVLDMINEKNDITIYIDGHGYASGIQDDNDNKENYRIQLGNKTVDIDTLSEILILRGKKRKEEDINKRDILILNNCYGGELARKIMENIKNYNEENNENIRFPIFISSSEYGEVSFTNFSFFSNQILEPIFDFYNNDDPTIKDFILNQFKQNEINPTIYVPQIKDDKEIMQQISFNDFFNEINLSFT